ncbi:MAG: threonine/serine dehydratase [Saprospiraceae bacterium]|nr:threonine/serine dehydratase [Saprospiraceae bacterium]MCB9319067.1 threonine/serine dehydratase [Lewinellaceae bacterium]
MSERLPLLNDVPTREQIEIIHRGIGHLVQPTPALNYRFLDRDLGCSLYFKAEQFHEIGAFKLRGATSAALALTEENRAKGIATHSSGNHAQATACIAHQLGIPAYIVMPSNAPKVKIEATRGFGAEITFCEPTQQAREAALDKICQETGAYFIHPYNNYNVIAGQATAAKELLEEVPDLDMIVAPVGGGGLLSGTALWSHYAGSGVKVFGAEPQAVDDAFRSMHAGSIQGNTSTNTLADGLKTTLGEYTFPLIKKYVSEILTVSEPEIIDAMAMLWKRLKLVTEPSGSVPFAAVLKHTQQFAGKRIGIILSGGNVDMENLPFAR